MMRHTLISCLFALLLGYTTTPALSQSKRARVPQYFQAVAHLEQNQPAQAATILDSLLKTATHTEWLENAGYAHLALYNYQAADSLFRVLLHRDKAKGNLAMAQLACALGNASQSIGYLAEHLEQRKKQSAQKLHQDTLLIPCQRHPLWDSLWRKERYTEREQNDNFLQNLADQKEWHLLLEHLESLPVRQQNRPHYAYLKSLTLKNIGHPKSALSLIKRIARRYPKRLDYGILYTQICLDLNQPAKALRQLARLLKNDPHNPSLLPIISLAHLKEKQPVKAYRYAQDYLRLYPKDTLALRCAAYAAAQTNRHAQSLRAIATLLPLVPPKTQANLHELRARQYVALGDYRSALVDLNRALEFTPQDTARLYLTARTYHAIRDTQKTCIFLKRAALSGHPTAYLALRRLCPAALIPEPVYDME